MGASGAGIGEGPPACPFVALEFDRDRRSDKPDYRHRCYAEPTPAPRAIAHQEAYCLSPNFSACPIFEDWARRAAARPVAGAGLSAEGMAAVPVAAAEPAPADEAESPQQLAAFAAPDDVETPVPAPGPDTESSIDDWVEEQPDVREEPARGTAPEPEAAPVPPFLAGRPEPPAPAPADRGPATSNVKREDVVPSWDIGGRYGPEPPGSQSRDRFGGVITALAVILILSLGVAGVIYLPGMLAGGGGPSATSTPSIGLSTDAPPTAQETLPATAEPTLAATPTATLAPPTATPGPAASPIRYRVEPGDSLRRIARRHGVTVQEILAINPQITNPNHIEVGQVIRIPQPAAP